MPTARPPVIGLPADSHEKDQLPAHSVGGKYVRAALEAARCMPLVIPALGPGLDLDAILDRLDGLIITGATSNVHPGHYDRRPHPDFEPYDHQRDATTLKLITAAIDRAMPLFCICRGFQELNVALGGTLDSEIQNLPGRLDHRAPESDDPDVRYGPVHPVNIKPGSRLHKIMGETQIMVNTVHRQAIAKPGAGIEIEATAPDGTIEAISIAGAPGFNIAVQWHPEYKATGNPHSIKLFSAFRNAAQDYMRKNER